jgi:L-ascorbate metabolism protein UlaG (beta-lactamase superfamily)
LFEYHGIKITWLGHEGFKIEDGEKTLVIDPFQVKHKVPADYALVCHEHPDHASAEDLKKVVKLGETIVVTIEAAKSEVEKASPKEIKIVKPGDKVKLGNFEVRAVAAYNNNKFRSPEKPFHPKEDGKVGILSKQVAEFQSTTLVTAT